MVMLRNHRVPQLDKCSHPGIELPQSLRCTHVLPLPPIALAAQLALAYCRIQQRPQGHFTCAITCKKRWRIHSHASVSPAHRSGRQHPDPVVIVQLEITCGMLWRIANQDQMGIFILS